MNNIDATLEQRLRALEGIALTRKTPGDISAATAGAVKGAKEVVAESEARTTALLNDNYAKFAAEAKEMREEIINLKKHLDERIHNAVDGHTVQALHDYHLLNEKGEPSHWTTNSK